MGWLRLFFHVSSSLDFSRRIKFQSNLEHRSKPQYISRYKNQLYGIKDRVKSTEVSRTFNNFFYPYTQNNESRPVLILTLISEKLNILVVTEELTEKQESRMTDKIAFCLGIRKLVNSKDLWLNYTLPYRPFSDLSFDFKLGWYTTTYMKLLFVRTTKQDILA